MTATDIIEHLRSYRIGDRGVLFINRGHNNLVISIQNSDGEIITEDVQTFKGFITFYVDGKRFRGKSRIDQKELQFRRIS